MSVDHVVIPKNVNPNNVEPGTWTIGLGQVWHRCPKCKKLAAMVDHSVDADGTAHASIACFAPCDYHVWGKLEGWTHGVKKAGYKIDGTPDPH